MAGGIQREELWITSKLWNTYHQPDKVEPAIRRTLSDLGVDYLDLYLIHFPISLRFGCAICRMVSSPSIRTTSTPKSLAR